MIGDHQFGIIANVLGTFIFILVIDYHYVTANPKYESK
ncbi:dolichyl-diphosphooligosaccharide--protein glycosyltransferase subunit 4A-like [Rosa chinensis]|nr:dolichyl-diphosphooligosaccharide--protein glycosyltransferase subunit 4A-like [Rosa chinensis]